MIRRNRRLVFLRERGIGFLETIAQPWAFQCRFLSLGGAKPFFFSSPLGKVIHLPCSDAQTAILPLLSRQIPQDFRSV